MQSNKKTAQAKKQIGRWAPDQHQRFMMAIATYGKDWKKVQQIVGTRSGSQVRSHAQKFFNKLLKQQSQKKGDKKVKKSAQHGEHQQQQSQNSFLRIVHQDGSNTTPMQIVTLIKGQAQNNQSKKVDLKQFQTRLQQKIANQNSEGEPVMSLQRQNSYKSMNNILEAYETVKDSQKNSQYQNQSFLMGLTKHYKKYFQKGGKFENLIDFGNPSEVEHFQKTIRKRSFTLPEGVQGDQQDLNQRKKRVVAQQSTAKLTQKEKQSFKQAMDKLHQPQKQGEKQKKEQQAHQLHKQEVVSQKQATIKQKKVTKNGSEDDNNSKKEEQGGAPKQ